MTVRTCFVLLCVSAGAALAQPRATIELLPEARVQADAVVLGQVAHLWSTDLEVMRKLVLLPIGRAPRAGEPALVRRETLAQWVRVQAGLAEGDVAWRGADSARVLRDVQEIKGADLVAVAVKAVAESLAQRGEQAEVHAPYLPRDLQAPAGELRLQARPLAAARIRQRTVVWVDIWCDAVWVRSVAVPVETAIRHEAVRRAGPPLQSVESAMPAPAPLVSRGEWATLRSAAGAVTLESRVEVLQDGRAGERVRVRQAGATGVVFARVVGAAQLELAP